MFFLKELPAKRMIEGYTARYPQADADTIERALVMMRDASLLVRRIDGFFAAGGFSQLRFLVLIVIDREPERDSLYMTEIAARLDVSRPVTTRTVQSLIKAGLVEATGHKDDKRQKLITITTAGHARLQQLLPDYYALISEFMSGRAPD
ncbi:MarR family winged helix-turn-helix transcriptional regulator [Actibacterium sp. 188UL27-1]|uniref:MarR family winged helix-turn-helix transcriptional regulator n=1 Tax=Actibacterium sp. 188UL27-1 TaxID=2786961 RepID=UPI00195DC58F|nr:MarR family transcriptional regulator [Actibacterium sp. 188UL27-1]MBM7069615.1 MarR family transcriptional regulator [Actibacterium sp. 188UL27-1]